MCTLLCICACVLHMCVPACIHVCAIRANKLHIVHCDHCCIVRRLDIYRRIMIDIRAATFMCWRRPQYYGSCISRKITPKTRVGILRSCSLAGVPSPARLLLRLLVGILRSCSLAGIAPTHSMHNTTPSRAKYQYKYQYNYQYQYQYCSVLA